MQYIYNIYIVYTDTIYIYIVSVYTIYSKTSLTDHLHRSNTALYRSLYFGLKRSPMYIL